MGRNRSLDEFLADADEDRPDHEGAPEESTGAEEVQGAVSTEPDDDPPDVEPMAETFAWSAAGGTCAGCGEQVEARWRDGATLVCPACKTW